MDPLLDLKVLNAWKRYSPSGEGYVEAPPEELESADIRELFSSLEDLEGDRTLAGHCVSQNAPNPGIFVGGKPLELPLSPSAFSKVIEEGVKVQDLSIYKLSNEMTRITNPSWDASLKQGVQAAFASLTNQNFAFVCRGTEMVVVASGSSLPIDLRKVSENHIATVLVVLPSYSTSELRLEARHGHLAYLKNIKKDEPFATHFMVMYAGMDSAVLAVADGPACCLIYSIISGDDNFPALRNLTGPREEISKAFAAWKLLSSREGAAGSVPKHILYQLDGKYRPKGKWRVSHISHPTDRLVLGHMAPPAKHYGFAILLARVSAHITCSLSLDNGSDDGDEYDDYTVGDIDMSNGEQDVDEVEWDFASLDGSSIEAGRKMEDCLFADVEGKRNIYNRRIDLEDEDGKNPDLDRDGDRDYTSLTVTYDKRASFLLIVPQKRMFVGLRDSSPERVDPGSTVGRTPYQPVKEHRANAGNKRQRTW